MVLTASLRPTPAHPKDFPGEGVGDLTFDIENFQKNFTETERPPNDRKFRRPGARRDREPAATTSRPPRDRVATDPRHSLLVCREWVHFSTFGYTSTPINHIALYYIRTVECTLIVPVRRGALTPPMALAIYYIGTKCTSTTQLNFDPLGYTSRHLRTNRG